MDIPYSPPHYHHQVPRCTHQLRCQSVIAMRGWLCCFLHCIRPLWIGENQGLKKDQLVSQLPFNLDILTQSYSYLQENCQIKEYDNNKHHSYIVIQHFTHLALLYVKRGAVGCRVGVGLYSCTQLLKWIFHSGLHIV